MCANVGVSPGWWWSHVHEVLCALRTLFPLSHPPTIALQCLYACCWPSTDSLGSPFSLRFEDVKRWHGLYPAGVSIHKRVKVKGRPGAQFTPAGQKKKLLTWISLLPAVNACAYIQHGCTKYRHIHAGVGRIQAAYILRYIYEVKGQTLTMLRAIQKSYIYKT